MMAGVLAALAAPVRALRGGKRGPADDGIEYDANEEKDPEQFKHLAAQFPQVDERDAKTPDAWVKRHPDLVRLTGKHPFNVEATLP